MSYSAFKISTHVLDTSIGCPVPDLSVKLYMLNGNDWVLIKEGKTTDNGRCENLIESNINFSTGTYKLTFLVKDYYESINTKTLYPFIEVSFDIDKLGHYHIPLLINAFGYTTYRGS